MLGGANPPAKELSFDELVGQRPSTHTEGLLLRRYLSPGETVLFETRPSFVGFALPGIIGAVVAAVALVVLYEFLLGAGGLAGVDPGLLSLLWGLLVVLALVGAIGAIVRWWFTCYAVSTTRILVKEGTWVRRIIDIPHQAVQSAMFEETAMGRSFDYGTLQFSSASVARFGYSRLGSRPGVINSRATPKPLETRAFVETVKKVTFE
jgi:membrane protein YdbS with pleckstrin-like domain